MEERLTCKLPTHASDGLVSCSHFMKFTILGVPQPKQSARFRIAKGKAGKNFVASYQTKEVKETERNIKYDIRSQLPFDFVPLDCPIGVKVLFVFPPLKSWSKKQKEALRQGQRIYKGTKPDLTDNLMKGLFDALNGLVFIDDARVVKVESEKIYGEQPRIELELYPLMPELKPVMGAPFDETLF